MIIPCFKVFFFFILTASTFLPIIISYTLFSRNFAIAATTTDMPCVTRNGVSIHEPDIRFTHDAMPSIIRVASIHFMSSTPFQMQRTPAPISTLGRTATSIGYWPVPFRSHSCMQPKTTTTTTPKCINRTYPRIHIETPTTERVQTTQQLKLWSRHKMILMIYLIVQISEATIWKQQQQQHLHLKRQQGDESKDYPRPKKTIKTLTRMVWIIKLILAF